MLAYYGAQISPHMTDTPEGYLICRDVPIARTGEMVYQASELGLDGPDRLVTVYRDPADVFHPDALASFEGKDVTSGHPVESVNPVNHAAYSRGHVQNVRQEGEFVIADLLVKDASLISDIKNGVVREIRSAVDYLDQNTGVFAENDAVSVFQRGAVNVLCQKGTPKLGSAVYVRIAANASFPGAAVGGFEAEADGGNTIALTGCQWAGPADANKVAELRILTMLSA